MNKTCSKCGLSKDATAFHKRKASLDGLQTWCKDCNSAVAKKWQSKRTPEQKAEQRQRSNEGQNKRYAEDMFFRQQVKDRAAKQRQETPPEVTAALQRDWRLRSQYGITQEDYDRLVAEQDGCCSICKRKKFLVVDHDHTLPAEESFRGLICHSCNRALAGLGDNIEGLENAIEYLRNAAARNRHNS